MFAGPGYARRECGVRILSIAYPFAEVGTGRGGGAERVLSLLDAAICRAGWESIVLATPQSMVRGVLAAGPSAPTRLDAAAVDTGERAWRAAMADAIATFRPHVTHLHAFGWERFAPRLPRATVATLHLPLEWHDIAALQTRDVELVAVSEGQAAAARALALRATAIGNGVETRRRRQSPQAPRRGLAWLARICPEKAPHDAIAAAKRAAAALVLAGPVQGFDDHVAYARTVVAPALDAQRVWIGPVTPARAGAALAAARGLLVTSRAPETSCLVAMEAAAAGVPVIAYPSGCVAEIVRHGETGFLVRDVAEMAEAIGALDAIDPARCRAEAEARFDVRRMTDAHLTLYQDLADRYGRG